MGWGAVSYERGTPVGSTTLSSAAGGQMIDSLFVHMTLIRYLCMCMLDFRVA